MPKRTPLFPVHEELDAKIVEFGGFDMPILYEGIKTEHQAVREKVGLFDVSHMGEFLVSGPEALELVQHVTINDASSLKPGKAQYSAMCYEDGGIVDDLLVYRLMQENHYIMVVNASNIDKDFDWIDRNNSFDAELRNMSDNTCLLAVQGPKSVDTLQKLTDLDLQDIPFYSFRNGSLDGMENVVFSATGYTGEKGFELYFDKNHVEPEKAWKAVMRAGDEFGIEPCGLGARDTLRLEMGFALYGNDITKDTNPLEARLGWLTKLDKGDFIGREALSAVKEEGISRKLVGLVTENKRMIPRSGYRLLDEKGENEIGFVTSGSQSITLGKGIGLGYVDIDYAEEGTKISVEIRNRKAGAAIVYPPFIER